MLVKKKITRHHTAKPTDQLTRFLIMNAPNILSALPMTYGTVLYMGLTMILLHPRFYENFL